MKNRLKTKIQYIATLVVLTATFLFSAQAFYAQIENSNTNTNNNTNVNQPTETTENSPTVTEDSDKSLLELNIEIEQKRKTIEELQSKTKAYQDNIKRKQQEAASLSNQVSIIEDEIATTGYEIEINQTEIEKLNLEIENLEQRIRKKAQEINIQKERMAELIEEIHKADQKTYLEITLGYSKFSDFFNQLKFLKEVETKNNELLNQYKSLKDELEQRKTEQTEAKNTLADKQVELEETKKQLDNEVVYKNDLLETTRSSEEKFKEILDELRAEQSAINSELVGLEKQAREKLELNPREFDLNDNAGVLSWPVSPAGGISAYFHDPTYIYRYIFEHPAIDIRVSQGTPVAAAADGYVVRAKNAGLGYSYIMLAHGNELSTVYGHISQINTQEDTFVERGQIIGLSGGAPGTQGAGRLTTGAHLHFEVRINGIPVDPLNYLP